MRLGRLTQGQNMPDLHLDRPRLDQTDEAQKFVNALKANFAIRATVGEGGETYLFGPN